eukprot:965883-Rhodomonas_salina.3
MARRRAWAGELRPPRAQAETMPNQRASEALSAMAGCTRRGLLGRSERGGVGKGGKGAGGGDCAREREETESFRGVRVERWRARADSVASVEGRCGVCGESQRGTG